MNRDNKLIGRMSQLGHTRSHTAHIVEGVTHHIDKAHRVAAQDSVPSHVIIPRDAKVSQVEEEGRVTGVWVDAKVFVSLSKAKGL